MRRSVQKLSVDKITQIKRLFQQGVAPREIQERLGVSRASVQKYAGRIDRDKNKWSGNNFELSRRVCDLHYKTGLSFKQIGLRMGETRNAVIGAHVRSKSFDWFDIYRPYERGTMPQSGLEWRFKPITPPPFVNKNKHPKVCTIGDCRLPRQPGKPVCSVHNTAFLIVAKDRDQICAEISA